MGWEEGKAKELIAFGGFYHKPHGRPHDAKPKRELDPERTGTCRPFAAGHATRTKYIFGNICTIFCLWCTHGEAGESRAARYDLQLPVAGMKLEVIPSHIKEKCIPGSFSLYHHHSHYLKM